MIRIILNLIILLSIFVLPVYISVVLIFMSIFIFNNLLEAIIWGFIIDLLYSGGSVFGYHFTYFFTVLVLLFYLISFKLKAILRMS